METPNPTILGRWLRHCRGRKSQGEVAAIIGMEQAEWSKWETGRRKEAKPEMIRAFARAVGSSVTNVALAYAGIWPLDIDASDAEQNLWIKRLRILDLPPDADDDELLMLKHLYRGMREYLAETEASESPSVALPGARRRTRSDRARVVEDRKDVSSGDQRALPG